MRIILTLFFLLLLKTEAYCQTPETIVGWDSTFFNYQSTDNATYWRYPYANTGLPGNVNVSTMRTFGGVSPSTASDAYGNGNQIIFNENPGTGWINGAAVKGWVFKFSTSGYESLNFSGKMAGSTSLSSFRGPRDFKLQYSVDSLNWADVTGGTIAAGSAGAASYTLTTLSNIPLPSACNNSASVYLRMIMTSNASPDGATATASGMSYVDDFVVKGQSTPVPPSNLILSSQVSLVSIGGQTTTGLTIGGLSSVDANLGNTFTYSLVSGTGDTHNGSFAISGTNLITNANLTRGMYAIRLRTTDNTGLFYEKQILIYIVESQPGIFSNPITGTAPGNSNPYTTGQTVAPNLTAGGIKRGSGLNPSTSNDRYGCTNWAAVLDANKYFEFTLTPANTYGIKFENLEATIQHTSTSAKSFALRSSIDNYTSDIFIVNNTPTAATAFKFPLLASAFQNVTTPITFRLYGWDATSATSTASINDFSFKGVVGTSFCTPTLNSTTISACGTYTWPYNNQTYTSSGVYTVVGLNAGGCTHTEILNLTILPVTTVNTTVQTCNSYTWSVSGLTYSTSGIYSMVTGCQNNILDLQLQGCADLQFLIEGYYVGAGMMQPVLSNQAVPGALLTDADSVIIEFRNANIPYNVVYTHQGIVSTNGSIHAVLPEAAIGQSFYLVIRHRNAVETWSAAPVLISGNVNYNFTSAASQAYASNQVQVEPGVWALYSGDINQDISIDILDYLIMDPDIQNGNSGFLATDLNGDGSVDVTDYLILSVHIMNGVGAQMP